ncbi:MAG: hypothetical protein R2862_03975 [Thermoanaerobaculia bacterium]
MATSAGADARRLPATLDPRLLEAVLLLRSGELAAAEKRLAPLLASRRGRKHGGPRARARRMGFRSVQPGRDRLDRTAATPGLEDWRLYAQAECAPARRCRCPRGARTAARPGSGVAARERAILRLSELALVRGRCTRRSALDRARAPGLPADDAARLEELAWKIGRATSDVAVETTAARRLLVGAPIVASQLEVVRRHLRRAACSGSSS